MANAAGPIFRHRAKDAPAGGQQTAEAHSTQEDPCAVSQLTRAADARASWPLLVLPAAAMADTFDAAGKGLPDSVGINSIWVIVAGCLVMFMQAGFAFLEIGFSRGKNAGTVVAKILTNFSIAAICTGRSASRSPSAARGPRHRRRTASSCATSATRRRRSRSWALSDAHDRVEVVLPVRLLRRLAGDRLGHDARAHQVRRLRHLRDRLQRAHLPDRLATGSSAAAGCRSTSACRTSPARRRST